MKLIKRIAFGSAGLLVLMMMLATFLEKIQGTDTAWSVIYGSPVFTTIWGIMTICAFAYLIHRKLQRDFLPETTTGLLYFPAPYRFPNHPDGSTHHPLLRQTRKHPFANERCADFDFHHFRIERRTASFPCQAARFPH